MIDDSIRRSDVIDKLMHIIPYKRYHNGEYILLLNKKECLSAIKAIPSVDRPQGEWINRHKWPNGFFERECSVCGAMKPSLRHTAKINFCPNCGASMRGKDDE